MKIGIFTNNYLPNPYGVTGSIESFRQELESRGHEVFIFAPHNKGYIDCNPNVYRYPSVDLEYKISFPLPIPYSRRINRILEKLDLDIIHTQHHDLLGKVARKWARKKKVPLVFTWHTFYDKYAHFVPVIPNILVVKWSIVSSVKYANQCDQVIVPTRSVGEIIRGWGVVNKNLIDIQTGIEEKLYQNPDRNKIRDKFGVKENETLLLLVSRISTEKNIIFLFNTVINVLKQNKNVKFLVAGEGHLIPELEKITAENKLEDRIILAGIVSKEKLKDYYAAGDIFVYGSKSETQGMVLTEAMYMGLPIVAVKSTGAIDIIEEDKTGFLVPEDAGEFARAVQKLINDKNLRRQFSEAAKKIAREKYTAKVCGEKMLEVYNKLLKK